MTSDKIGRYEIVHEIARGGMAIVYLAKDSYMERLVAVKVLPQVFMHDPQFEKRFTREARVVASLEHPAIVPVYDFGYHGEQPFMVYRFMSGGTLKEKINKEGAKSLTQTARLLSRLAPAIDKAHDKGIIHRDLKPSNILFDDEGKAYIADFGIAKIVESTSHLTGNAIVGTPAYMSPEQFTGDAEVGRYSDIYALGIILYELLSGELPFKADTTPRLMKLHIMDPVPSIRDIRSELPNDIDEILGKALAKSTEDRYQRVEELRASFERVMRVIPTVHDIREDLLYEDAEATIREPEPILRPGETTAEPVEKMVENDVLDEEIVAPNYVPSMEDEEPIVSDQVMPVEDISVFQTELKSRITEALQNVGGLSKNKTFLAVLLTSLGWSMGGSIGAFIMSTDPLYILSTLYLAVGAIGGISFGLSLKWLKHSTPWLRIAGIPAIWTVSWGAIWYVASAFDIPYLWWPEYILIQIFLSGIAALVSGVLLFWDKLARSWKSIIVITLGWGFATGIGLMLLAYMSREAWLELWYLLDRSVALDSFIAYVLIGVLGSVITFKSLDLTEIHPSRKESFSFTETISVLWRSDYRLAFIIMLLSWPISELVSSIALYLLNNDPTLIFILNGAFAALLMGIAIRMVIPSFTWSHILIIMVGWALAWEARWHLGRALTIVEGLNGGWFIIRLMAAGVGGLVFGRVLKVGIPTIKGKQILRIAIWWMLGWGAATVIAGYFHSASGLIVTWSTPIGEIRIAWILSDALVGLLGGVLTFREILPEGVLTVSADA